MNFGFYCLQFYLKYCYLPSAGNTKVVTAQTANGAGYMETATVLNNYNRRRERTFLLPRIEVEM